MFDPDYKIMITGEEIFRSIMYRLAEYKSEFLERQKQIRMSNPGFDIQNSKKRFFARLENNPDIGIEFFLPNL